ncbi:hypothetical protein BC828DRAFT_389402 [Blastocladiella britannica]|nr:hypothetical protein BC828DRAFT_389402 [Blastocladiella britannica]
MDLTDRDRHHIALAWAAAAVSIPIVIIDLAMIGLHISYLQKEKKQNMPTSVRRKALQMHYCHLLAWASFLVGDLASIGFATGFAVMRECGGYPTYYGEYGRPNGIRGRFWAKNCTIIQFGALQEFFGFVPMPFFPASFARLVLQLEPRTSRWPRRFVVVCVAGTVLAMVSQEIGKAYQYLTTSSTANTSIYNLMRNISDNAYFAHMALVLLMGGSSIAFTIKFLRITTARIGVIAAIPESSTTMEGASFGAAPHVSEALGASSVLAGNDTAAALPASPAQHLRPPSLFSRTLTLRPLVRTSSALPATVSSSVSTHTQEFQQAAQRMKRIAYLSALMLVLTVLAIIVVSIVNSKLLVTQVGITLLGRALLASFGWTMLRLKPLMILRRRLPNVDAGTLAASSWSAALPPPQMSQQQSHLVVTRDKMEYKGSWDALAPAKSAYEPLGSPH